MKRRTTRVTTKGNRDTVAGAMSDNGALEAGKRCAFLAAVGRPEQVPDGHDRVWQHNVHSDVPARISEDKFDNVPARVELNGNMSLAQTKRIAGREERK